MTIPSRLLIACPLWSRGVEVRDGARYYLGRSRGRAAPRSGYQRATGVDGVLYPCIDFNPPGQLTAMLDPCRRRFRLLLVSDNRGLGNLDLLREVREEKGSRPREEKAGRKQICLLDIESNYERTCWI
jgi:hypothetical protein